MPLRQSGSMEKYIHAFWQISDNCYAALQKIEEFFGNFAYAWERAAPAELARAGLSEGYIEELLALRKRFDLSRAMQTLWDNDVIVIGRRHPEMPPDLMEIEKKPFLLYRRGTDLRELQPRAAIVGTRKSSVWGEKTAFRLAGRLGNAGVTVVSGLAFGIDASAHAGAISDNGKTIAILASGIGQITPSTHNHLSRKILETGGAIISEYPLTSPAFKFRFLERNRLISGLSGAVVIVEAARRSGALITAGHAAAQKKLLLVFPGAPGNPSSAGCNSIIKNGARLVDSIGEIIEILQDHRLIAENSGLTKLLSD